MANEADAAKREAGKSSAEKNNTNSCITAEIGKVYLTLEKINGVRMIEFSTDCIDDVNDLLNFAYFDHDVMLEDPGDMFESFTGRSESPVQPKVFEAIRRWIAKNTYWQFVKK